MGKSKAGKETPLMKQYNAIKAKHPGALLLFRVGDFYETFGEDAIRASEALDIVLTKRSNGAASQVELAGFPHHALDSYLPKLVRAGYRVAICDQLEDPKAAKGVVKRGVTELVTPGLSLHDQVLQKKKNNYLASVYLDAESHGLAFLDVSTGEFMVAQGSLEVIEKLLQGFLPAEVIFSKPLRQTWHQHFGEEYATFCLDEWIYAYDFGYEKLIKHFGTTSLKGFGIETMDKGIVAAGAILHYLEETEHRNLDHISSITRIEEERYVWLDKFTVRNLELLQPQQEGGVPLIDIIDHTVTPMGSRLLKKWTVMPLKVLPEILERRDTVSKLAGNPDVYDTIRNHLNQIGDLERLISKVAVQRINPREMLLLKKALMHSLPIKKALTASMDEMLEKIGAQIQDCKYVLEKIDQQIKEDAPLATNQGGIFNDGVNEKLDELRKLAYSGKDYLVQIQKRESDRTGIPSLKIAYNKVFGYYLEVTHAHKDKVPAEWVRKQTLVNAERYITEELKQYEDKILSAEDRIFVLEQQLYQELVAFISDFISQIQQNARVLARLDCLASFTRVALEYKYVRPELNDEYALSISKGRHPVIERQLPAGEKYIPNDVYLDSNQEQILIITGPNMAGKSALLRQTALIVILAQMGSFVPAEKAILGITDKIFTRVGASDNLARGESTFMVEMVETSAILNNLSDRSLILLDEIGRGTSTYDGVSIAWAIVEYLHDQANSRPKTLFATHYHELNELAETFERIRNYNVAVKEVGDSIVFLRKLQPGGSEHSFGIHVAQMAGMPNPVVLRAHAILQQLERERSGNGRRKQLQQMPRQTFQLNLFEADPRIKALTQSLNALDINTMSPVEALLKLNELKNLVNEE